MLEPNNFKAKKILFFAPNFFGYGQKIANKLETLDCIVHYYDEKPDNNFLTKALIRINKKLLAKRIRTYYVNIFKSIEEDYYDFVFFLSPESISNKSLKRLKKTQPNATFILYMWDSLKNRKNVIDLLPYFELKYSFDKKDCSNPEENFQFRPLFFIDEYKKKIDRPKENIIDILFIGTVHSDRYRLLLDIKKECRRLNRKTLFFMFFQSKIMYYLRKMTDKHFRKSKISEFEFESLTPKEVIEKVNKSRAVLDIQHPGQNGLTMRVIEMLGAKKKIVTTNEDILNYDFYNTSNILYIDRKNPILKDAFFENEYVELEEKIYFKYSLDGWLQDVFFKFKRNKL